MSKARHTSVGRPRIVVGVTADASLRLLRSFPEYLAESGWDVHVVCSPGPLLDEREDSEFVTYHALSMERRPHPARDLRAFADWWRLLGALRPDVTTIGTPKAALLGGVAAALHRVPARVLHQRGLVLETAIGTRRVILRGTEWLSILSSTVVLAVSRSLKSVLVRERLVKESQVVVLGEGSSNGVDTAEFSTDRFTPAALQTLSRSVGLSSDRVVIGYVGRVTIDKGFAVLADACLSLARNHSPFTLLVVGGVEDEESRALLAALRREGIDLREAGSVTDPAAYYQLIDVLCLPTFREGLPNVVLEAAAAGKPTVTTNATGAIDSVIHEVTGLVVAVGDASALATALSEMVSSQTRRLEMGKAAKARVQAEFERANVWAMIEKFYRGLLRSPQ